MKRRINISLFVGCSIIAVVVSLTIVSFVYTPYDANAMDLQGRFQTPSVRHLFGTDNFGRDVFSRVMHGGRSAFLVGGIAVGIGMVFGTLIGGLAGYFGSWIDELLMRAMDGLLAFPGLIMALIVIAVAGPGTANTALAIGIMTVPSIARIARSGFLQFRTIEFVESARVIGVSNLSIMLRHIFPNVVSSLVIAASLSFAGAILSEAGLSYLGLGVQLPTASWGRMLREAQGFFLRNPWATIGPGLAITALVMGFYLIGNGVRDVLDKKGAHL